MTDPRKSVFNAIREARGKGFSSAEVVAIDSLLDRLGIGREGSTPAPPPFGPPWLTVARALIGTREIPGPQHNSWISKGWARLGAGWFNDDETPWCGYFVAHCLDAVKLPYPGKGMFARAKAWLDWGKASKPVLGAVAVFDRDGGGHVGFLVGESADSFYVLGGNQGNMVSIAPIAKSRALGFRWPISRADSATPLPRMSGGVISRNEA